MNASCAMRVYNVQRNRPGWVVSPGRAHVAEMATGGSVISTLQRGAISILRLQSKAA
jgi:hypothetical protein